jgi:iron complex outermembrane receptor protein
MGQHRWFLATVALLALPATAVAQRADENAVTAAEDAFGTSIGFQNVGLYSPDDARGFSPQQAGNLRIEGLYFDQQTWTTGGCMVRESTMRVGIAAQSYSFPAPTGIADLSLRTPGDEALASAILTRGPFDAATADLEAQLPLLDHTLGVDLCAGYRENFAIDVFRKSNASVFGTTFRWRPATGTDIVPFWSYVTGGARQIVPVVYTDGTLPLPLFRTQDLARQDWTNWGWHQTTFGAVVKSELAADRWTLAAGLFHSLERDPMGYDPYLTLLTPRTADSVMDVVPPFMAESTSGELRLSRLFSHGSHRQQLQLAVRGRTVNRDFGGDSITDFGNVGLTSPSSPGQPNLLFGPVNRDRTRQLDLGLTFEERWLGVGSFAAGVLDDHYHRSVQVTGEGLDTDRTRPRLANLRLTIDAGSPLILYGSLVQGLEDSALAPVSADNRNEPPPATRSRQVDGGLRWTPSDKLALIFGGFDIHKPYFNVDADNIYTQLGRLRYRGLETSLSYSHTGLTVLVGGVRLQPHVTRLIPEPGATGDVPLGPVPLTLTANADYAPPRWGPWAASLQWNRLSSRVATTDDSIYLPALSTLAAGIRYHWTLRSRPWTLRLDGLNLTDARGLHVSNLDAVLPEQRRRFMLTLATDQ